MVEVSAWKRNKKVAVQPCPEHLSLSRLHHGLLRSQAHPEVVQGTAEGPHPSAAAHLLEAASVFDAATALDTATDMVDPQPRLVELLVRHVLLPRELLPQIEINSIDVSTQELLELTARYFAIGDIAMSLINSMYLLSLRSTATVSNEAETALRC